MQTVLIAIRNYADDDSGNVDIHSRLTVKPFKKMKGAGRLFLLKNVDRELVKLNNTGKLLKMYDNYAKMCRNGGLL